MTKRVIGILTGGGDAPGLNNAIKQVVNSAAGEFIIEGITEGWKGAIMMTKGEDPRVYTLPLITNQVRRIDRTGGTILMSSRANPFNYGGEDLSDKVAGFLSERYHAVIALGGEDTLGAAGKLYAKGLDIIGIPKTIDKDLCQTRFTLGFDTATNIIKDHVISLKTPAGSHGEVYFIEAMGRNAGHLTYWGGIGANAHFITIPEAEIDAERLIEAIERRRGSLVKRRGYSLDGLRYTIVVVSEGTRFSGVGQITKKTIDPHGNQELGDGLVALYLQRKYKELTGCTAKTEVIGRRQRGGSPSAYDNLLGILLGQKGVDLIRHGDFGRMATFNGETVGDVPLESVIDKIRILDADKVYDPKRYRPIIAANNRLYHEIEVSK
ncbi:6-phosphofructokinase [Candidatus Woesearchaeota archaeon]|nr:6-phosphofructokinase [Candidatus Woesearchaeota archaeon]